MLGEWGPTASIPLTESGRLSPSSRAGGLTADRTSVYTHMASLEQLGFNALLQLMIGVPLEMVHGLLRISLLYLAGVLAGEAGTWPLAIILVSLTLMALPLLTQAP